MTEPIRDSIRLGLPYARPPLSLNDRGHYQARARAVADVRATVGWLARAAHLGRHDHVTVELHYVPARAGRRDADNPSWPPLKACCDALVDAGLVDDDTPEHMTKPMPVIHPPDPACRDPRRLWLQITPGPRPAPTGEPVPAPTDSPPFTELDAAAFTRLLQGNLSTAHNLTFNVDVDDAPTAEPDEPPPCDCAGDGDGDDNYVMVSVNITRDGRSINVSTMLPVPLADGELAAAVRGCCAGALANAGETDQP